jgi:hypothetical protein
MMSEIAVIADNLDNVIAAFDSGSANRMPDQSRESWYLCAYLQQLDIAVHPRKLSISANA